MCILMMIMLLVSHVMMQSKGRRKRERENIRCGDDAIARNHHTNNQSIVNQSNVNQERSGAKNQKKIKK
jgi:hypothetical protein